VDQQTFNAEDYEARYRSKAYLPLYPDSQVIRVHRHILEWQLGITDGAVFDFGCGGGNNPSYFADQGFVPHGCDSSAAGIERCRQVLPEHADNFFVVPSEQPDLLGSSQARELSVFLSNQVLYYLDDEGIRHVVRQAYEMVRPGGAFVATMMTPDCFYADYVTERRGDLSKVELATPRLQGNTSWINFKQRDELIDLFAPFEKLHIGAYDLGGLREDEGPTTHWIYTGVRR
jgi:SAM-dependent methyltransferase